MIRYLVSHRKVGRMLVAFMGAFIVAAIPGAVAAQSCEECISATIEGTFEHWFGNHPEDSMYECTSCHDDPEGGECHDYHEPCAEEEEEEVQQALAAIQTGEFNLAGLESLKQALGGKLVLDGDSGTAYAMSCRWELMAQFDVPVDWITSLSAATFDR